MELIHPIFILVFFIIIFMDYFFRGIVVDIDPEDKPQPYKIGTSIILTLAIITLATYFALDYFEIINYSLKWFLITTFSLFTISMLYFELKYLKLTKIYLLTLTRGIILLVSFFIFL